MEDTIQGMMRTHKCAELEIENVDENVTVMGWTQRVRDLGGVIFIDLRDISGILQIVFRQEDNDELFRRAESIRNEYVLAVKGKVVKRAEETVNPKLRTGEIEVVVSELRILSQSETSSLPIEEGSKV